MILVSTSLMLVISEGALRILYPQQLGVWYETRDGLAIHRPNSVIRFGNHEIHINSVGMRDREHSVQKADGTIRILLLGDSFMEALQIQFEESFPKLLEDRLRQAGVRNVEVVNAAVSGWGTEDELAYWVRYGKALKPDLILVAVTLHNDVSDNLRQNFYTLKDGQLQARPIKVSPTTEYWAIQFRAFIASHLHLIQLWRKFWHRGEIQNTGRQLNQHVASLLSRRNTETIAKGWELTFQEFAAIQSEAKGIRAKMAIVLIPLALQVYKDKFSKFIRENDIPQISLAEPQEKMINFGRTQGIETIDLLPVFKEWREKQNQPLYLENDGHWNSNGHRVAADSVATELQYRGLLKNAR